MSEKCGARFASAGREAVTFERERKKNMCRRGDVFFFYFARGSQARAMIKSTVVGGGTESSSEIVLVLTLLCPSILSTVNAPIVNN